MQTNFQNGWPNDRQKNPDDNLKRAWYHSDIIDIAYIYVYKLFEKFTETGKLNK